MNQRVAILVAGIVLLGAAEVQANSFDLYGAGTRAPAMGSTGTADAEGYAALFFNPARLAEERAPRFDVSVTLVAPDLEVARGAGEGAGGREAELPESNLGVTVGLVVPGSGVLDWLTIGVAAYLPTMHPMRIIARDPSTPHFPRYDATADQILFDAGFGLGPWFGLSLGAGVQVVGLLSGEGDVLLNTAETTVLRRDLNASLDPKVSSVVGVHWATNDDLVSLGATFRDESSVDYHLPITLDFEDLGVLAIGLDGQALYTARQWSLGTAVRPGLWTLTVDVTWSEWSRAPAPSPSFFAILDDSGLNPDAPQDLLSFDTPPLDPGFQDTLAVRAGIEYRLLPILAVRGGYAFEPTPVPDQVGLTNYLDTDVHRVGLGATITLGDPLAISDGPIGVETFVQANVLPTRTTTKIQERDIVGIGDYDARGVVWVAGLGLVLAL